MVFSSLFFLYFFLPLNLVAYYLCKTIPARNTVMLVFSLIFYAWGEPKYVFLLVAMAWCDWYLAGIMERSRRSKRRRRKALFAACAINLGLLAGFTANMHSSAAFLLILLDVVAEL